MQLSLNWLRALIDLSDLSAAALAAILTERVAEVESLTTETPLPKSLVVGKIQKIERVPGADRIQLTEIDLGHEKLSIICGAANIKTNALVPVALVGTTLPGNLKIEKRKIRGLPSCGMLCSESELGRSEKANGIWLLPPKLELGTPLNEIFPPDTILTIDNHALTHRPDLFSVLGFARELAAILDRPLKFQPPPALKFDQKLKIENRVPTLCPRYIGLTITNLKVTASPPLIQARLKSCGIRPINNLVDATNYVLLELGQPLHAFDAAQVSARTIVIRKAAENEKITALDEQTYTLQKGELVIADPVQPLAFAGLLGGASSEITENSTAVILESANFAAAKIRQLSTRLGLRSESSLRFEKGLDPNLPALAAARALTILRYTCPELKVHASSDFKCFKPQERQLTLNVRALKQKLQLEIPPPKIEQILTALNFSCQKKSPSAYTVNTPSCRRDIKEEIDLIEELGRLTGYSKIKSALPHLTLNEVKFDPARELLAQSQNILVGLNFHETLTLPLVSAKLLQQAQIQIENAPQIQNPPSLEHQFLRNSLLASLLKVAQQNSKHQDQFRLFEIARIFRKPTTERQVVVALLTEKNAFRKMLGVLTTYLKQLKIPFVPQPSKELPANLHPGRGAEIKSGPIKIGVFGQIHPLVLTNFELPESAYFCLDFEILSELFTQQKIPAITPPPKFPGVTRDLAFHFAPRTLAYDVFKAIENSDSHVQEVELFDEFLEQKQQRKNLAFHVKFRSAEKTLSEKEEEAIFQKIVAAVAKIGGKLRAS